MTSGDRLRMAKLEQRVEQLARREQHKERKECIQRIEARAAGARTVLDSASALDDLSEVLHGHR